MSVRPGSLGPMPIPLPRTDSSWVRPAPSRSELRADAAFAALIAVGAALSVLLYERIGIYKEVADPWVWVLGLGLCILPLAVRRRYPEAVLLLVAVGFFVCGQFGVPEILFVNIGLFCAYYTVGAWGRNRVVAFWLRLGVSIAMLAWLIISLIVTTGDPEAFPAYSRIGVFSQLAAFVAVQILTNLLYFAGAAYFGQHAWRAARTASQLDAQGRELELERRTSAAQAVALDRLGVARELHDVVAHHVSVMGIQAAAARRSLDRDPALASEALAVVEESAHTAVTELRGLVRTLRSPDEDDAASTVGVAQFAELAEASRRAGTPTELIVIGESRPLPMLVDVALYRVVQEALTNVRKHAGSGASCTVRLRFAADAVEVEVTDDGIRQTLPGSRPAGSQLGLRGMRERVGAVGGTLQSGRREQGGFLVRARVPLGVAAEVDA